MARQGGAEPKAAVLLGPTASGKTELATTLARDLPLDLISADSVMIYRGMDIGSAKPSPQVLRQYPHALIDILDPSEAWSAGEFVKAAVREVEAAHSRGRIPLLVGGAMLYLYSLLSGLAQMPPADPEFRRKLRERAQQQGWETLHSELLACDPVLGRQIHPADGQRIERALEVFALTGKPLSHWQKEGTASALGDGQLLLLGLTRPREQLHERIDRRLDSMLAAGLVDEVQMLYERGDLHRDMPSIRSIGYRQVWQWLEAGGPQAGFGQMVETIRAATRTYLRRQENWMRRFDGLTMVSDLASAHRAMRRGGLG